MEFATPPTVPLWRTAIKRTTGTVIPRIEARAASLVGTPEAYASVCGIRLGEALPPCFPDLLCRGLQLAVLTSPAFPVRLLGIVHARQQIEQRRCIARGEALSGHVWVEGSRPARKGGEFDLHTVVHAGGDEVWHGMTTILSRDLPARPRDAERSDPTAHAPFASGRTATWTLPEDLGRRYAKVSGDVNPIHQYAWTARLFGFKRPIIHGWWTLARCLAELDVGGAPLVGLAVPLVVHARFLAPIFLPSTVRFESGAATELDAASEPGGCRGRCDGQQQFLVRSGERVALGGSVFAGAGAGDTAAAPAAHGS